MFSCQNIFIQNVEVLYFHGSISSVLFSYKMEEATWRDYISIIRRPWFRACHFQSRNCAVKGTLWYHIFKLQLFLTSSSFNVGGRVFQYRLPGQLIISFSSSLAPLLHKLYILKDSLYAGILAFSVFDNL